MASINKSVFINLIILISIIITIQITYGLPMLKLFNSIHIKNIINIETISENDTNDRHDNNRNNNRNNDNNIVKVNTNPNNNKYYNNVILKNNYTINATVTKQSMIYDPATTYFKGEVVLSYNNDIHNHYFCKINVNPIKHESSKDIQNYIYYEFNLGKYIRLICDDIQCVFNSYYNFEYKFNFYVCDVKYNKYINNEF